MLIRRADGQIVEVDEPESIKGLLAKSGWRQANYEEAEAYHLQAEELLARTLEADNQAENTIYYQTVSSSPDGYGMSRDIIKTELFGQGIMLQEEFSNQKVGLLYSYPNAITSFQNDVRLIMTMFESDSIPEDWPEYLKVADEVIVPSTWCHDVFLKAGIATTVVPLGYNSRIFKYVERPIPMENDEPFTFIHYNSFNMRKGFSEIFQAFTEEFKDNEPVKLILKTTANRPPIPIMKSQYPNIEIVTDTISEGALVELLSKVNCMVYPSRGEGFGITPLEAMATGLPAIVPNAHGISEYFNSKYMLEVKADEKCPGLYQRFKGEYVGDMVVCDVKDLKKQMRYAYNNQKEMYELGKSASEYVKKYTYIETGKKLAKIIRKWENTEVVKRNDSKYLQVEKV